MIISALFNVIHKNHTSTTTMCRIPDQKFQLIFLVLTTLYVFHVERCDSSLSVLVID